MAVAGRNRGDVESHLQRNFSLADPATVLDDVFGRGTDSDKRVTWPEPVRETGSGAAPPLPSQELRDSRALRVGGVRPHASDPALHELGAKGRLARHPL